MRKYIFVEHYLEKNTRKKVFENKFFKDSYLDPKEFIKKLKQDYEKYNSEELLYEYVLVSVEEVVETKKVYLDPYLKKLRDIDEQLSDMINSNDISKIMLIHIRSKLHSISNYQLTEDGIKLKNELLQNIKLLLKEVN